MAADNGFSVDYSGQSTGSFASSQFFIVKSTANSPNGDKLIALSIGSSGGAAAVLGVIQNNPTDGQAAIVRRFGPTKVSANGTIAIGDPLACTTGGQAITANTTGQYVWGRAESASTGAAGQVIEAFVFQGGRMFAGSTA